MFPWSNWRKRPAVSEVLAQEHGQIELVYPQYLDVSMMMSSLAYIAGGVSWEEQRRTLTGKQSSSSSAAAAGVGVSPLVSSLLSLDLRGNLSSKLEEQHGEEVTLMKRHTEASLFMTLRSKLRAEGLILALDEAIPQRAGNEPRKLVEVSGDVVRNPLVEVFAAFDQVLPFMERPEVTQTRHDKNQKHGQQESPQVAAAMKVKEGLDRSSLVDLILNPDDSSLPKCVLTLSKQYLRDPSAEDLLGANLTILGRITKVLLEGESIDLLRRSVFRYLVGPERRRELFEKLRGNPNFQMVIAESDIGYPAVQILPMALFA